MLINCDKSTKIADLLLNIHTKVYIQSQDQDIIGKSCWRMVIYSHSNPGNLAFIEYSQLATGWVESQIAKRCFTDKLHSSAKNDSFNK